MGAGAVDEMEVSLAPRHLRVVADDEAALVDRARHDRDAFGELYRRHVRAVYGYAYRLTGSATQAEDVTAATFERALRALPSFRWQAGGVRPWLLRIAANEANGWFRSEARQRRPRAQSALRILSGDGSTPPDPASVIGRDVGPSLSALRAALATLPDRHREVIGLRYLAGMSADEAATALGCSKATLAVALHRALAALRRALPDPTEEAT